MLVTSLSARAGVQPAARCSHDTLAADPVLIAPQAVRLPVDGAKARPFVMRTRLTNRLTDEALAAQIKAASPQRYGRDVKEARREVIARFKLAEAKD